MCLLGSGAVFWRRFLSVRCMGFGERLMSADRVRHGIRRKIHFHCYILTHRPKTDTKIFKQDTLRMYAKIDSAHAHVALVAALQSKAKLFILVSLK